MKCYFAPMEGITGYVYRGVHHTCFGGIDRYFSPFITARQEKPLSFRDQSEIMPEHNAGLCLIPQILTNKAEDFIRTAAAIREYGYQEVNLNLGCPSMTVVSKNKGAGFLAVPEELDRFLDRIVARSPCRISIKTRLGKENPEEFERLLKIYNQYPLTELIIHPRVQTDFYKNKPNRTVFAAAQSRSLNEVVYNGDLFTLQDCIRFHEEFPDYETVMIGRGLVASPGLAREWTSGESTRKTELREFHDRLLEGYEEMLSGDRNVLFRMKELWYYMGGCFTEPERYLKKIRKAQRICDYAEAVRCLFQEQDLLPGTGFQAP